MAQWFAVDRQGQLAVFSTEHDDDVPKVLRDPERGLELATLLARRLIPEARPVPGKHVRVRQGLVLMLARPEAVEGRATNVERVDADVIAAHFAPLPRGAPSSFLPGVRTFGGPEPAGPTELERVHELGLCGGCGPDVEDDDEEVLHALGFYVYGEDYGETLALERQLVPATPRDVSTIGDIARELLTCTGTFASDERLSLGDFKRRS